jgi:hypothetical protein
MGIEMKVPESCENVVRNRKQKTVVVDGGEKRPKSDIEVRERVEPEKSEKSDTQKEEKPERVLQESSEPHHENFTIKIEFDPMSIALFALATVTRFFRLAEPRNVV